MDEKVRKLLDNIPERPPRSKLERHAEVIRELRRKRRTYQEIAAFLKEHLQVSVAPSTLHTFVKSRARQMRNLLPEVPEVSGFRPPEYPTEKALETAPVPASPLVCSGIAEPLRAVREQPSATPKEQPLFQFDAQEQAGWKPKPEEK